MRRASKFCKSSNFFCKCEKCKFAIEKAKEIEFTEVSRQIKIEQDCRSSRGRLSDELMREVV